MIDVQVSTSSGRPAVQIIHQEHASGASRARPLMAKLMRKIGAGDVHVVVRLDRRTQQGRHPDRSCNRQPADKEAPARTSRLADRCCVQMRLPKFVEQPEQAARNGRAWEPVQIGIATGIYYLD